MVHHIKLKVNLGKFKDDLLEKVFAANTPEQEKEELQVMIHFTLSGAGAVHTQLDTLSIATMKELSGKDWIGLFELCNFATTC